MGGLFPGGNRSKANDELRTVSSECLVGNRSAGGSLAAG